VVESGLGRGHEAAALVGAGGQPLLHALADLDVLPLHEVGEGEVGLDPRAGRVGGDIRVVVLEDDPAAIGGDRDDDVRLQAAGQGVQLRKAS